MHICVKALELYSLDYPAISNSPRLFSLDIPWLTCVTTHTQITGSLIHLWGSQGGWEAYGWSATPGIILHLAFPRRDGRCVYVCGGGRRLVLLLSLLSLYTLPRIRLVAPADMWTDSCQQDVLKQKSALQARITPLPLGCPWSAGQLIPYHCFAGVCLLQRVSVTSLVLTSAHQQTTPVFIFVCEIPAEKHSQMGTSRCQWHTRVNR